MEGVELGGACELMWPFTSRHPTLSLLKFHHVCHSRCACTLTFVSPDSSLRNEARGHAHLVGRVGIDRRDVRTMHDLGAEVDTCVHRPHNELRTVSWNARVPLGTVFTAQRRREEIPVASNPLC